MSDVEVMVAEVRLAMQLGMGRGDMFVDEVAEAVVRHAPEWMSGDERGKMAVAAIRAGIGYVLSLSAARPEASTTPDDAPGGYGARSAECEKNND